MCFFDLMTSIQMNNSAQMLGVATWTSPRFRQALDKVAGRTIQQMATWGTSRAAQRIIIITWVLIILIELLEHIRPYSYRERESHYQTAKMNACNIFKIPIWLMCVWYFNNRMYIYIYIYRGSQGGIFNVTVFHQYQAYRLSVWQWHTGPVDGFGIPLSRVISMRARPKLANLLGLASGESAGGSHAQARY